MSTKSQHPHNSAAQSKRGRTLWIAEGYFLWVYSAKTYTRGGTDVIYETVVFMGGSGTLVGVLRYSMGQMPVYFLKNLLK